MKRVAEGTSVPWHRQPLVWLVIAIPASAVLMGVVLIVVSIRSFDGVVEDDYYRRGLEINRDLARDRLASRRGLRAELSFDWEQGVVEAALLQQAGTPDALPDRLRLSLVHPTRAGRDRTMSLERGDDGRYRGWIARLAPGNWHLRIETEAWRISGRMPVPGTGRVGLSPEE